MNRFFVTKQSINLAHICKICPDVIISGVNVLEKAGPYDLTFFHNARYKDALQHTKAAACLIKKEHQDLLPKNVIPVILDSPYRVLASVLNALYEPAYKTTQDFLINPNAKIGQHCDIGPNVFIGQDVHIGDNCTIGPFSYIGPGVSIGEDSTIESHVTITHATLGHSVYVKTGARIGQRGFGFDIDKEGHIDIPQIGSCVIGNRVLVGANTTIDRGSLDNTIIEDFCYIDNLVQIAHNVKIGTACVIVAQVGIAGSAKIGPYCQIGGQVGIAGHINIGKNVKLAARSGVMQDIPDNQVYAGAPAMPAFQYFKNLAYINKMTRK